MDLPLLVGAGALAGVLNDMALHPIDTARAQLQALPRSATASLSPARALSQLWQQHGLANLYRGFSATLLFSSPAWALYFATYTASKRLLEQRQTPTPSQSESTPSSSSSSSSPALSPLHLFGCGLAAEAGASLFYIPYDVTKQRLQCWGLADSLETASRTRAPLAPVLVVQTLRSHGLRGLYPGLLATVLTYGPFSGCYFAFYETLLPLVPATLAARSPAAADAICAFSGGALAAAVTQPADVLKTRIQIALRDVPSLRQALQQTLADGGVAMLFRGTLARVFTLGPSCCLSMTLFQAILRHLGRPELAEGY